MKRYLPLLLVVLIAGCGEKNKAPVSSATEENPNHVVESSLEDKVSPPKADIHFYSLEDNGEYGYEQSISQSAKEQGQAANSLVMVSYAGQKDGKYQVFSKNGQIFTALECSDPCEYIKAMTFEGRRYLRTDRIKFVSGTIAANALTDAFKGYLQPAALTKSGNPNQKFNIWFTTKGSTITPISDAISK